MKRLLGLVTALVLATSSGANAECYPPSPDHAGRVDHTQVAPGECVTFSGGGFRPNATVVITDNGAPSGSAKADNKGDFSKVVCFDSDTEPGQHELVATGPGKGGDCGGGGGGKPEARTVRATVYVLGAGQVAPPRGENQGREDGGSVGGVGAGNGSTGGGLPFSGDMTLVEGTVGLLLLLFGAATLIAARPRRRSSSPA